MQQTCRNEWCKQPFDITDEDLSFYDKVSPIFDGKKELIPPPTLCPHCRLQRRLAFRNQMYINVRESSLSGKTVFSMFTKDVPFPVYEKGEWWSDSWDGITYGRQIDDRSFIEQFQELRNLVPHPSRSLTNAVNSDYCNNGDDQKNCYFVFNTSHAEDCMFCENAWNSKDCMDCTRTNNSELCVDCVECMRCYGLQSSDFCDNCSESFFLAYCNGCKHCFGCANLSQAEYCIFNVQYSKEEYEQKLSEYQLGSFAKRREIEHEVQLFLQSQPRPHTMISQSEEVSGNYIYNSKDIFQSFFIKDSESIRYCSHLNEHAKDCMDHSFMGINCELIYECAISGFDSFKLAFCNYCWPNCSDCLYCWYCAGCSNCFGCVGLRKKQYCIFNTQYTKEEYEKLVPQLIAKMRETGEWGEFFPLEFSPIPYNQSLAQRFFPMQDKLSFGGNLKWFDDVLPEAAQAIDSAALPDTVPASDDTVVVKSLLSQKPFKITAQEVKRRRQFGIPLPRITYDERMQERARRLGGIKLYERTCAKTGKQLQTTYPPDSPWIIWDRAEWEKEFRG